MVISIFLVFLVMRKFRLPQHWQRESGHVYSRPQASILSILVFVLLVSVSMSVAIVMAVL
jgi:hypothetical protein